MTGIAFESPDPRADHEVLKGKDVDVDAEIMGGDGTVPLLFFFRDNDGNHLDGRRRAVAGPLVAVSRASPRYVV
jgi:hypothetical protein